MDEIIHQKLHSRLAGCVPSWEPICLKAREAASSCLNSSLVEDLLKFFNGDHHLLKIGRISEKHWAEHFLIILSLVREMCSRWKTENFTQ